MLLITRREGESILIGDSIEVVILEASATRVKIGIAAPIEVTILRKEIRLAHESNRAAARGVTRQSITALLDCRGRRALAHIPVSFSDKSH